MKNSNSKVLDASWHLDKVRIERFNKAAIDDSIGFSVFLLNNIQWLNEQISEELKAELKERMAGYL